MFNKWINKVLFSPTSPSPALHSHPLDSSLLWEKPSFWKSVLCRWHMRSLAGRCVYSGGSQLIVTLRLLKIGYCVGCVFEIGSAGVALRVFSSFPLEKVLEGINCWEQFVSSLCSHHFFPLKPLGSGRIHFRVPPTQWYQEWNITKGKRKDLEHLFLNHSFPQMLHWRSGPLSLWEVSASSCLNLPWGRLVLALWMWLFKWWQWACSMLHL
jgi:hypothetical protein